MIAANWQRGPASLFDRSTAFQTFSVGPAPVRSSEADITSSQMRTASHILESIAAEKHSQYIHPDY